MPDEEWPNDPNQRQVIISDFDLETKYGDRRQEIVFIGANMDETAICQQLDTALLTEEEMVKYEDRYSTVRPSSIPGVAKSTVKEQHLLLHFDIRSRSISDLKATALPDLWPNSS